VTPGSTTWLIQGTLVPPGDVLVNGPLLLAADGHITCAACDCSAVPEYAGATRIACANGVVTPGLINGHDHLSFSHAGPVTLTAERYEHRLSRWKRRGFPPRPTSEEKGFLVDAVAAAFRRQCVERPA
jgi:large repetitive protein